MALPFISGLFTKKPKRNIYFGLILRESSGFGYVFERMNEDIQLLKDKPFTYSNGFDKILDDVDETLYSLEKSLKQKLTKTLFIVPSLGLKAESKDVVQPYRGAISEIVKTLELEAIGYIELVDVLKTHLGQVDASVYIELGKTKTSLVFIRRGERWKQLTVNTHPANILSHLSEFVTRGSNIYLYTLHEAVDVEDISQHLSDYVINQGKDEDVELGLLGILKEQLLTDIPQIELTAESVTKSTQKVDIKEEVEMINTKEEDSVVVVDTENVKVIDEQIPVVDNAEVAEIEVPTHISIELEPGIVEGFTQHNSHIKTTQEYVHAPDVSKRSEESDGVMQVEYAQTTPEYIESSEKLIIDKQTETIEDEQNESTIDSSSSQTQSPLATATRSLFIAVSIILVLGIVGASIFEIFFHKVAINIMMPTETLAMKEILTAIPVSKVTDEKDIDVSINATGKKEIGERAKGQVILASFDDKEASFSAGTKLVFNGNVYRLDAEAILPASTVDTSSGTKAASKKSVATSATFIGPEGNIDKGKQFVVGDYPISLYYALSENPFVGGTAQTVSIVSAKDMQALDSLVTDKAKQASESARLGSNNDTVTLDDISNVDISSINYSANVGEIASSVQAYGTVKADLYTIKRDSIISALRSYITTTKGKGYQFITDGLSYTISDVKLSDNSELVDFVIQTDLSIYSASDIGKLKSEVRLSSIDQATNKLKNIYRAEEVQYVFDPALPGFSLFVPYKTENILINIQPVKAN